MNFTLHTATSLLTCFFSLPECAPVSFQCEATERSAWISPEQISEQLSEDGWRVRRITEDDGCWEVYGTTLDGQRVEVHVHPVSGEVLLISQRGTVHFRKNG